MIPTIVTILLALIIIGGWYFYPTKYTTFEGGGLTSRRFCKRCGEMQELSPMKTIRDIHSPWQRPYLSKGCFRCRKDSGRKPPPPPPPPSKTIKPRP